MLHTWDPTSPTPEEALQRLVVVGTEYELETGEVHFFDGLPASEKR